jgi:hypothetical protein
MAPAVFVDPIASGGLPDANDPIGNINVGNREKTVELAGKRMRGAVFLHRRRSNSDGLSAAISAQACARPASE